MKVDSSASCCRLAAPVAIAILVLQCGTAGATDTAAPPAMPPVATPPAGKYQLEKSHASLLLRVSHLGFSTYTTRFSRFDAELMVDPANLTTARVTTTIDAASIEMDAAPATCLDIVRGPQLLDTAKYPHIVFRSEQVRMTGANSMDIAGNLTLHGVTRPIVLAATFNGGYAGMPGMDPHARIGFSAHGSLKRSDFGMGFGVPAPGSTMGVGDLVDFSIEAEFSGPALAGTAGP